MISIEQVRALEARVEKAVALITSLRSENAALRTGLEAAKSHVVELETRVAAFQKDQAKIEEGIMDALRKLDCFEDSVHEAVRASVPPSAGAPRNADKQNSAESGKEAASLDIF